MKKGNLNAFFREKWLTKNRGAYGGRQEGNGILAGAAHRLPQGRCEMREKIRAVMRFSGPRMIFHHPVAAVRHVLETKKEEKRLEKCNEA